MIADIITEIERLDIEVHAMRFAKSGYGDGKWRVKLSYKNAAGDKLEVERTNADFEAAFIAAYEAVRQGMHEGVALALPIPDAPPIRSSIDNELPF